MIVAIKIATGSAEVHKVYKTDRVTMIMAIKIATGSA